VKRIAALALLLAAAPAFAQQNTLEQRVGAQLGSLMLQNAVLSDQIEKLQAQLVAEQAKAKACESPKKD